MKTRTLPGADRELLHEVQYYESRQPSLGLRFRDAVIEAALRAYRRPEGCRPEKESCRSIELRKFPHRLIFFMEGKTFVIVALAHPARRPGYWRERLS